MKRKQILEIKKKVDEALLNKLRSIEFEIHTRLQHYLENLIPQIQYANLSKTLIVYDGINIMNLERFSEDSSTPIFLSLFGSMDSTLSISLSILML